THDADLRGMVVLRSLGFQLVPFKLHRFRKQRRCQIEGRVDTSLPFISMSVHGVVNDELGIVSDGKYHKVSGEYFIVSDIVNRDMELDLRVNNGVLFYPSNTALFELNYM
ncbi:hypothetical protein, partial [Aeromonas salmonicida]